MKQKTTSKDAGLIINESLSWKEHMEYRISKALKSLFLLKRNTHQSLTITAKVHLYRAIINPVLLFGSECWELKKADHKLIENFYAKALKWICGNMSYIDSLISTNILPSLYCKVLKDFLLYSNIINDYYTVDLTEHYEIKREGRQTRIILPTTSYEAQRQNFWYRSGFRINKIQKHLDFFNQLILKQRLITSIWKYLKYYWAVNNPCTWIFVCLCEPCRSNPLI